MVIGPAHVLAVLVGLFNAAMLVFIRGSAGAGLILLALAAILGAWAGDAIGGWLPFDPIRVGDFHVVSASVMAWLGMGFIAVISVLGPSPDNGEPEELA